MNSNRFTVIKLFLASSINDTATERDRLQHKIEKTWNGIFRKHKIELSVFRCEDMTAEYLKNNQQIIDEEIRNSDIFIVLFKNSVGEYTYHEFNVARESLASPSGRPHIYPYISRELMERFCDTPELYPELGDITSNNTYCKTFDNLDTVAVNLLEAISDMFAIDIRANRNGCITFENVDEDFEIDPKEISKASLIRQKAYIDFCVEYVRNLYVVDGVSLLAYRNQTFPDIVLFADDTVREFDRDRMDFAIRDNSRLLDAPSNPLSDDQLQELKERYRIRNQKSVLRYPFYDFMNDKIILNDARKIQRLDFYVDTDEKNVFSTLTMRDEVEAHYERCAAKGDFSIEVTEDKFPVLTSIRKAVCDTGISLLSNGGGRCSAYGLQVIVLFKVKDRIMKRDRRFGRYVGDAEYWTPVIRRADHVREQPGFYQFAPCGTFRVFAEPEAAAHKETQRANFDFFNAILYHYTHELFSEVSTVGEQEFGSAKYDIPEHATLADAYLDDPHAVELFDMLESKKASLEFLGMSSSLLALKSDLVFLLVIGDEDYYSRNKRQFKSDYEAASLNIYPIKYMLLPDFLDGEDFLAQEIAGPLELLRHSKLVGDILFGRDSQKS